MTSTLENTTTQPVFSIRPKPEPYGFWGEIFWHFFLKDLLQIKIVKIILEEGKNHQFLQAGSFEQLSR